MGQQVNFQQLLESIQPFWFSYDNDALAMRDNTALWWQKQPEVDAQIRDRYLDLYYAELCGRLDSYTDLQQMVSRIILLDQFARNMFRDLPQAFFGDGRARWLACRLLPELDRLHPMQQLFVLLVFEHSESLADQLIALDALQKLHTEVQDPEAKNMFAWYRDFAQRHLNIIARFGRFPHRNALLARTSTTAEEAFLQQPGSSF